MVDVAAGGVSGQSAIWCFRNAVLEERMGVAGEINYVRVTPGDLHPAPGRGRKIVASCAVTSSSLRLLIGEGRTISRMQRTMWNWVRSTCFVDGGVLRIVRRRR